MLASAAGDEKGGRMSIFEGGCHCGAVAVRFETAREPDVLPVRACGCTYCRKHGSRNTSDGDGTLTIFADDGALNVYRFGAKVTDFLACATCGVYVAATMAAGGKTYATLNLNVLDGDAFLGRTAEPANYDAESGDDKIVRRRRAWTPATFAPRAAGR